MEKAVNLNSFSRAPESLCLHFGADVGGGGEKALELSVRDMN